MSIFRSFMDDAIVEGLLGSGVPIGCIAVKNGEIVAKAHNNSQDRIGHAEMLIIADLQAKGINHFEDISLYITVEPCCMCMAALSLMRVKSIFYALEDKKFSGRDRIFQNNSAFFMPQMFHLPHKDAKNIMQEFFQELR